MKRHERLVRMAAQAFDAWQEAGGELTRVHPNGVESQELLLKAFLDIERAAMAAAKDLPRPSAVPLREGSFPFEVTPSPAAKLRGKSKTVRASGGGSGS